MIIPEGLHNLFAVIEAPNVLQRWLGINDSHLLGSRGIHSRDSAARGQRLLVGL